MGARPQEGDSPAAVIIPDSLTALGLVRSLAKERVPCTVCAWNALGPARYSRHARVVSCPPQSAGRAFVDALLALGRSFAKPPVLFVTDESSMLLAHQVRDELAAHFLLTLPAPEPFNRLVVKSRLYELGVAAGVPTPDTWVLRGDDLPAGIRYPVVMKPAQRVILRERYELRSFRREFGCKALLAENATQVRVVAARAQRLGFEMLLQQPVHGPVTDLLTAGIFAGSDGRRALFTARKLAQVPGDFGDGSVIEGLPLSELEPLVWRLVDHTGFVGVADIEFKRDAADGQLKLLDVNPRPWLWIELATRCGVNLPYLLYCEAVQRRGATVPQQTANRVIWCSVRSMLRAMPRQGLAGCRPALKGLLYALRGTGIEATLVRDDPLWRMFFAPRFWRDALRSARDQRL